MSGFDFEEAQVLSELGDVLPLGTGSIVNSILQLDGRIACLEECLDPTLSSGGETSIKDEIAWVTRERIALESELDEDGREELNRLRVPYQY